MRVSYDLHLMGKDKRGVPVVRANADVPRLSLAYGPIGCGLITALFIAPSLPMLLRYGFFWVVALLLMSCALLLGFGVWAFRLRRKLMHLAGEDQLAERFGCDSERLRSVAEQQGILPRYNVNGRDYYEPADFGDAATLLRPAHNADLLRPAAAGESKAENLLRASHGREG